MSRPLSGSGHDPRVASHEESRQLAVPALDARGWLPPGEHECTLLEVQACFASTAHSLKRQHIFAALREHLQNPLVSDLSRHVLINGGFVSIKPDPKDVDIILGLAPGSIEALFAGRLGVSPVAALALLEGRLSRVVDGHRLIHGFADDIGGPKYEGMRQYFQRSDRVDEPMRKGILLVELN